MNQAIAMARNAPPPSVTIATDSRQDALNGATLGDSPLAADAVPGEQAPGDRGDEGDAGRHERPPPDGRHDGQASRRDERLPDADRPDAPEADEREHGDHDVGRQDQGGGTADEGGQRPRRRPPAQHGQAVHREQDRHGRQAVQP